ncbi:class IV adenylate cyclase [Anabaena sp. UHCC 0253]|uniref:class IV adenylate cyclase n=1 Tax=Anabaena sp. UHCC 0253 TaxID=2590019 RepID=UPI0014483285|nr:class IV adenylate cyclase [Anabaena sp. UHCC 0253]
MANNDTEIELRFSVDNETFIKVEQKLKEIASFVKENHQVDKYFNHPSRDFMNAKSPFEWLSIRERGDKFILNYKHFYPEDAEIQTHCDEFEVQFQGLEQLNKMFDALGFQKLITIEKTRSLYSYNNEFEICLDTIEGLGKYIEIEAIKDFGSVETTRENLFAFAERLGIDTNHINNTGYPILLLRQNNLIK